MTPYYSDEWLTVYAGDCRAVLAELPERSVHCVVTSPPYWGLRDYGTASWENGTNPYCDHLAPMPGGFAASGLAIEGRNGLTEETIAAKVEQRRQQYRDVCGKCGANRVDSQIGLEPTPEQYVESMVAVFRAVRRVLRDDGTVWLNLGDSYAAQRGGTTMPAETIAGGTGGWMPDGSRTNRDRHDGYSPSRNASAIGLKHKDLVGIPWRVAFALQADGWYLRSDIVWSKPNPMPESVTDRPTKSHEYVFLLAKSARYYFDADAVREGPAEASLARIGQSTFATQTGGPKDYANGTNPNRSMRQTLENFAANPGRNLRSVWTIATQPYPGAHFATFPEALVEPCVKAGTSEKGVCPECGAPWVRVVEVEMVRGGHGGGETGQGGASRRPGHPPLSAKSVFVTNEKKAAITVGWRRSCAHDAQPVPATVLDIFAGSGTTGRVAQRLGRRAVLIDLNPAYLVQAMKRNARGPDEVGTQPMFDQSPLWTEGVA